MFGLYKSHRAQRVHRAQRDLRIRLRFPCDVIVWDLCVCVVAYVVGFVNNKTLQATSCSESVTGCYKRGHLVWNYCLYYMIGLTTKLFNVYVSDNHTTHIYFLTNELNNVVSLTSALLPHWGRDKMANIFLTTFSNAFSWMEMYQFRFRFHWNLFLQIYYTSIPAGYINRKPLFRVQIVTNMGWSFVELYVYHIYRL